MIIDQDTKELLIAELKKNFFSVSKACEVVGISIDKFNSFKSCEFFQSGLGDARQWRDDYALVKFKDLLDDGNAQATIEFQKMLRQSDDKNEALNIRKKTARYLIETADTKALVLRQFSDIFDASAKISEKFYQIALTEYGLLSPQKRKKELLKNEETKLSVLFSNGDLDEGGMIFGLLKKQLEDAENSEYPSERAKATEQSIKLTQRMDEIKEKKVKESEKDSTPKHLLMDQVTMGASKEHLERARLELEVFNNGITG